MRFWLLFAVGFGGVATAQDAPPDPTLVLGEIEAYACTIGDSTALIPLRRGPDGVVGLGSWSSASVTDVDEVLTLSREGTIYQIASDAAVAVRGGLAEPMSCTNATDELRDVVLELGGGEEGLAVALFSTRNAGSRVLVLEREAGVARQEQERLGALLATAQRTLSEIERERDAAQEAARIADERADLLLKAIDLTQVPLDVLLDPETVDQAAVQAALDAVDMDPDQRRRLAQSVELAADQPMLMDDVLLRLRTALVEAGWPE